jgi:hypothetical protein
MKEIEITIGGCNVPWRIALIEATMGNAFFIQKRVGTMDSHLLVVLPA